MDSEPIPKQLCSSPVIPNSVVSTPVTPDLPIASESCSNCFWNIPVDQRIHLHSWRRLPHSFRGKHPPNKGLPEWMKPKISLDSIPYLFDDDDEPLEEQTAHKMEEQPALEMKEPAVLTLNKQKEPTADRPPE